MWQPWYLQQIYSGKPKFHPTLMELSFAVEKCDLSKKNFKQMIEARNSLLQIQSDVSLVDYMKRLMDVNYGCNLLLHQLNCGSMEKANVEAIQSFSKAQGKLQFMNFLKVPQRENKTFEKCDRYQKY